MIAGIMGLLSLIPGVMSLISAVTTAAFNAKVKMYMAKTGLERDVAVAAIQAEAVNNQTKVSWIMALAQNPVMMFIVFGFAFPFIVFEWKCVVYDIVWMGGTTSTDPIKGQLADWAQVILGGIFVTSTGVGIAHTIINRNKE